MWTLGERETEGVLVEVTRCEPGWPSWRFGSARTPTGWTSVPDRERRAPRPEGAPVPGLTRAEAHRRMRLARRLHRRPRAGRGRHGRRRAGRGPGRGGGRRGGRAAHLAGRPRDRGAGSWTLDPRGARAAARFTMSDDGRGRAHGRFTLPTMQAQMLHKTLLALAAPMRRHRPTGRRRRHLGGRGPPAGLPGRDRSGSPARRLQVLDLGRSRRLPQGPSGTRSRQATPAAPPRAATGRWPVRRPHDAPGRAGVTPRLPTTDSSASAPGPGARPGVHPRQAPRRQGRLHQADVT